MDIPNGNRSRRSSFTLVIATVAVTSVGILGLLYSAGLFEHPSSAGPMVHQEGVLHTPGMEHPGGAHPHESARQEEVAGRGAAVMPFELDRTTHRFANTGYGGLQQVLSDDGDTDQIALIQAHLEEEASRFQQGDFDDPAHIHGNDMPGLAALRAGLQQVSVTYEPLPDGAQIDFRAETPDLIAAIHAWFDAQLADHGTHATDGQ